MQTLLPALLPDRNCLIAYHFLPGEHWPLVPLEILLSEMVSSELWDLSNKSDPHLKKSFSGSCGI